MTVGAQFIRHRGGHVFPDHGLEAARLCLFRRRRRSRSPGAC
jgi:hypothetical protein